MGYKTEESAITAHPQYQKLRESAPLSWCYLPVLTLGKLLPRIQPDGGLRRATSRQSEQSDHKYVCSAAGTQDVDLWVTNDIALNVHRVPNSLAKGSPTPGHSILPTTIKALPSMKLQSLRQKLRKTFKVSPKSEMSLYLEVSDTVVELGLEDSRDLDWWGFDEGSHLFVYIP